MEQMGTTVHGVNEYNDTYNKWVHGADGYNSAWDKCKKGKNVTRN